MSPLTAQLVGGPTAILECAGLRWLTDPSLSPHEHHSDNLDLAGREFRPRAGRVLTTVERSVPSDLESEIVGFTTRVQKESEAANR
jgi:hypothetical protein